jgi:hypothetical protein
MSRTSLAYVLLVLVAFGTLDDAYAASTPGTSDDLAAAEDNEYLPPTCSPDQGPRGLSHLQPPSPSEACSAACENPVRAGAPIPPLGSLGGLSPLSALMSLRC